MNSGIYTLSYLVIGCLVGFGLGVLHSTVGVGILFDESDQVAQKDVRFESVAYTDRSPCPDFSEEALVGRWVGSKDYGEAGGVQKWKMDTKVDGTFKIEFTALRNGLESKFVEEGYWGYSRCLYTDVVVKNDGKDVLYQNVYRMHELDNDKKRYTHYSSGTEFESTRWNGDGDWPTALGE